MCAMCFLSVNRGKLAGTAREGASSRRYCTDLCNREVTPHHAHSLERGEYEDPRAAASSIDVQKSDNAKRHNLTVK